MDVSIAVSLIRGQMGAVVERAVNGAVETVLAEMLKVVGVKFEELKSQVALMKRDMTVLQREKALKDKENENIRAKLRYTELKLKYYRQGVEEELQQRVTASGLVNVLPPSGQRGASQIEATPSCSGQTRTGTTSTSPQSSSSNRSNNSGHGARPYGLDVCETSTDTSNLQLSVGTLTDGVDNNTGSSVHNKEEEEHEWTITLQQNSEEGSSLQILSFESGQTDSRSPERPAHADSSTLSSPTQQVKQEQQDEEVICIKAEPGEQDVAAMFDCLQPKTEATRNVNDWSAPLTSGRNPSAAGYLMSQPPASVPTISASFLGPRQQPRPWTRPDLSLYEEYKRRRNELRQLSMNKRREMEKTLPQPLLSDMIRERREKTRLRVAKWRAKRKLQACLNQDQTQGGAAGLNLVGGQMDNKSEIGLPRVTCGQTSSPQQQRQSPAMHFPNNFICNMPGPSNFQPPLPYMVPTSPPSSLLMRSPNMSSQSGQHIVTSSSSGSYAQMNFTQQSISPNDSEIVE